MFSLTVVFGPTGTAWGLLFKTKEAADAAFAAVSALPEAGHGATEITDDFGQSARIEPCIVHGVMLEDMSQSQLGTIERSMHEARTRAKVQGKAMTDPELKMAMRQPGPAIHTPSGMA